MDRVSSTLVASEIGKRIGRLTTVAGAEVGEELVSVIQGVLNHLFGATNLDSLVGDANVVEVPVVEEIREPCPERDGGLLCGIQAWPFDGWMEDHFPIFHPEQFEEPSRVLTIHECVINVNGPAFPMKHPT